MKCVILISLLLFLTACRSDNPDGKTKITQPKPQKATEEQKQIKEPVAPPEYSYFGVHTEVQFSKSSAVIISVAQIEEKDNVTYVNEYSKIIQEGETYYIKRFAQTAKGYLDRPLLKIKASTYDVRLIPENTSSFEEPFNKILTHVSEPVMKPINVNTQLISENLMLQHNLWTSRCKLAEDWEKARRLDPITTGNQLISLPQFLAIDKIFKRRTVALEVDLQRDKIVGLPTKFRTSLKKKDDHLDILYGGIPAYRTSDLWWSIQVYSPEKVFDFHRFCDGIYTGSYIPVYSSRPYSEYYPPFNREFEEKKVKGQSLLKKKFDASDRSRLNKFFQKVNPNLKNSIPSKENLEPEDLEFLLKNGFTVPETGEFL